MAHQEIVWVCDYCKRKIYKGKKNCEKHEDKCWQNPKNEKDLEKWKANRNELNGQTKMQGI